jgi:hypothetical protein
MGISTFSVIPNDIWINAKVTYASMDFKPVEISINDLYLSKGNKISLIYLNFKFEIYWGWLHECKCGTQPFLHGTFWKGSPPKPEYPLYMLIIIHEKTHF